jgi:hypothetical protein
LIVKSITSDPFVCRLFVCPHYCVGNSQPISTKLGTEVQTTKCEKKFVCGTHWIYTSGFMPPSWNFAAIFRYDLKFGGRFHTIKGYDFRFT